MKNRGYAASCRIQREEQGLLVAGQMENEDDITSGEAPLLPARLEAVLGKLWRLRREP